jgi:hypothetical protein
MSRTGEQMQSGEVSVGMVIINLNQWLCNVFFV